MERLIWAAWRAFWVGLGASAVLITQSVMSPAPIDEARVQPGPGIEHVVAPATNAPVVSSLTLGWRHRS